jgi:hypothetical protein
MGEMLKTVWQALKKAWGVWTRLAHKIGNFQARVLLTILYAVLVLPFGILTRLFGDPLRIKKPPSRWLDRPDEATDLQWARRQ